jgi:hypothetical protein
MQLALYLYGWPATWSANTVDSLPYTFTANTRHWVLEIRHIYTYVTYTHTSYIQHIGYGVSGKERSRIISRSQFCTSLHAWSPEYNHRLCGTTADAALHNSEPQYACR